MSILVYGFAKSGKSSFAVTAPAPRLLFDVESASRFLSARGTIKPVEWDPHTSAPPDADGTWDTAIVSTRSWDDVAQAYKWLESGQHPFSSVIIDSLSELQTRYVEKVAGRAGPSMQQWGDTFRVVSGLVRDLRDLTMHQTHPLEAVVFTCMSREYNGIYRAYVAGQLVDVLPYLCDLSAMLWVEDVVDPLTGEPHEVRRLLTRRAANFEAGERLGGQIPSTVDNPNIVSLLDMVFGAKVVDQQDG